MKNYILWVNSTIHRTFSNLGKEIVTAVCALTLISLFFYMFTDFLNAQLKLVPEHVQRAATAIFSYSTIVIVGILGFKIVSSENTSAQFSISNWLNRIGAKPSAILRFRILRAATLVTLTLGSTHMLLNRYLTQIPDQLSSVTFATMLATMILGIIVKPKPALLGEKKNIPTGKLTWRISIMMTRNKYSRTLLRISLLACLLILLPQVALSKLFSWAIFFLIGTIGSFAMYVHLSEEITSSWLDKNCGMSHGEFMSLTTKISLITGLLLSGLTLAVYVTTLAIHDLTFKPLDFLQLLSTMLISLLVVPNVILQIDARRPSVNMMSGFLISLFIGTAFLAHIASLIIIPILFYYGQTTQVDRYYRA